MDNLQSTLDDVISELGQVFADYRNLVGFNVFRDFPNERKVFIATGDYLKRDNVVFDSAGLVVYLPDEDRFYVNSDCVEAETEAYAESLSSTGLGNLQPLRTALLSGLVHGAVHRSTLGVRLSGEQGEFVERGAYLFLDEQTTRDMRSFVRGGYDIHLRGLRISLQRKDDFFFLNGEDSDEFVVNWITDNVLDNYFSNREMINHGSFRGFVSGINATEDLINRYIRAAFRLKDYKKFHSFLADYMFGAVAKTLRFRCIRSIPTDSVLGAVRELLLGDMYDFNNLIDVYETRDSFMQKRERKREKYCMVP